MMMRMALAAGLLFLGALSGCTTIYFDKFYISPAPGKF